MKKPRAKFKPPPYQYTVMMADAEHHYQVKGLLDIATDSKFYAPAWDNARVLRLCNLRHCTLFELGMYYLIPQITMVNSFRNNIWPSHIALHFQQLEAFTFSQMYDTEHAVFPPRMFVDMPNRDSVCPACGRSTAKHTYQRRKEPSYGN